MANAIIMAAGTASRFVPLSQERPKGLLEVKGEVLIERQIRQLIEAGVDDITLVAGYKAELFEYLKDKYDVDIVINEDFNKYNNTSSIIRVIEKLDNTFICCSDNYFHRNVFMEEVDSSYYSALYADGETGEYCLTTNENDEITHVSVGGKDSWYMVGHVFFNREFSKMFREIMIEEYKNNITRQGYWEDVYIRYIDKLPKMKIHKYADNVIEEFDSLDELRLFDKSYIEDTRSSVVKAISKALSCKEGILSNFKNIKDKEGLIFSFEKKGENFIYNNGEIIRCLREA